MRQIPVAGGRPNPLFTKNYAWSGDRGQFVLHALARKGTAIIPLSTLCGAPINMGPMQLNPALSRTFCGTCASLARETLTMEEALIDLEQDTYRRSMLVSALGPKLAEKMFNLAQRHVKGGGGW